ncbi:MAG: VPS10 domain-containing protein [Longimicrobiales bacterium]
MNRALLGTFAFALAFAHGPLTAQREAGGSRRAPALPPVDSMFQGFDSRVIGPSGTSGRIAAIEAVDSNPDIIYVGAATGGVWKSVDGGVSWTPIFDDEAASSIGAIAVFEPNPDIVWVATGEGNPRNSAGVGRGVWKSLDSGRTWSHMGLAASERIHRVITHPTDPDVVYLAVLGPTWSDGQERGVYRTSDGGRTWDRLLYVDAGTGAADLVMDPSNPNHLIAAMWDHRRTPWSFRSGGPGSGIRVTWDGGASWTELTEDDGLPKGELGRIGLAFAASGPEVVYALVEAEKSALLRSDDGGRRWRTVNDERGVSNRPFYYSDIRVDPTNENRVYRLASVLDMSEDGGRTFRTIGSWSAVHPDHHALWIEPTRGELLINGNDGGVYISTNRGQTWRFVENIPVAQFYHLSFDMDAPFHVYGGLQDNGSWMGPSAVWEQAGFNGATIQAHHWRTIGFGDGFAAVVDPRDPTWAYSMSQGGWINRVDLRTNEWKSVRPQRPADGTELRFNWNAGLAVDPHRPGTLYYGSQFVHRTRDRGQTWEIISPDLTTNDSTKQHQAESGGITKDVTAAENHTTIMTIAPSPVTEGVIWVGTDDGNVQLTRDAGASWTNVVANIRGVPEATWVPHIEASKHDAGTAYVVFDDHRRGNWTTYVFRTTDYGRSWSSLATPAIDGFVHVIEEDPVTPDLLFLGTEFGLFLSTDAGRSWRKWTHGGFPTVPVLALAVHPRDHDLIVGTHGRAAWIIDDIRALREVATSPGIASRALHIIEQPAAIQHQVGLRGPLYFPGHAEFFGENRPYGAVISYFVGGGGRGGGGTAEDSVTAKVEILDGSGDLVQELDGGAKPGVNRVVWNLRQKPFRFLVAEDTPEQFRPQGPEVLPGEYTVRVTLGEDVATTALAVLADPRREVPLAARQEKREALVEAGRTIERATDATRRLEATAKSLDFVQELLTDSLRLPAAIDSAGKATLVEHADSVEKRLNELLDELRLPPTTVGIVEDRSVASELAQVYGTLDSSTDEPTAGQLDELERRDQRLREVLAQVDAFYTTELAAFREAIDRAGLGFFGGGAP